MEFKLQPIEIPKEDPFRDDALNRKQAIETVTKLVEAIKGPFVLAIDSPWGTGKTTFTRIWKAHLEMQGFACLYFNAWETDFSADPLVAFLGEIDSLRVAGIVKDEMFGNYLLKAKKIGAVLAKHALPAVAKLATSGILDLDSLNKDVTEVATEFVAGSINDAIDAYAAEKKLISGFRDNLEKAVNSLDKAGKKDQLIVFVDEIDRCRPTFAIELLERIKHLFNVRNVIFVLSLDKSQLSVSLQSVYGLGMNTQEYLRRFVDLEFVLPEPNAAEFTKNLFDRFGFAEFFRGRTHPELSYDKSNIEAGFNALSDLLRLSLRAREQCFTQLRVAMFLTKPEEYLFPLLLVTLIALKAGVPDIYRGYGLGGMAASEVVSHLRSLVGGKQFLAEHIGISIEGHLIAAKSSMHEVSADLMAYKTVLNNGVTDKREKNRLENIIGIVDRMSAMHQLSYLEHVVSKIEFAAKFQR